MTCSVPITRLLAAERRERGASWGMIEDPARSTKTWVTP